MFITVNGVILTVVIYFGIALLYGLISSFVSGLSRSSSDPDFFEAIFWPFSFCYLIGLFANHFRLSRKQKKES